MLCGVEEEGFGIAIWDIERTSQTFALKLRRKIPQTFECQDAIFSRA